MNKKKRISLFLICLIFGIIITGFTLFSFSAVPQFSEPEISENPEQLLHQYMEYISKHDYTNMYAMLNEESKANYSKKYFIERNQNIYEGIDASDLKTEVKEITVNEKDETVIIYHQSLNSVAGDIQFSNQAVFMKDEKTGYSLKWEDHLIFPDLTSKDKVTVSTLEAKRGEVLDRNGNILAGQGLVTYVCLVPGKMNENAAADKEKLSMLLEITAKDIQMKLDAKWVKEDSLVPITTLPKVSEADLMAYEPSEENLQNKTLQEELLTIPGVMLSDTEARVYPLGKSASHLTGYIQNVTAEDLEKHGEEGYGVNSVIGRSGMELLYEKELKGQAGCEIKIVDEQGKTKAMMAFLPKEDGKNIQLTIDSGLQQYLYDEFQEDKSCSVAMNPYTGEVLALVSTPSFDSNDFIKGLSDIQWKALNDDERKPLYNRFRQTLPPGSTFKPVIAAIGLTTGAINPTEDFGNAGLSWQKDAGWGDYYVTTLHAYDHAVLENALIYSDNIYFAKAALNIGAEPLANALDQLGFNQKIPFEISMTESQYSNSGKIESEILLADSGYGQGQILVNPLHLAALYTAFSNEGNILKPYLLYKETPVSEIWLQQAFSPEIARQVEEGLIKVVNSPEGTGFAAKIDSVSWAGKTGTAEIKASKEDTNGTELGWFTIFTTDPDTPKPILLISMVEDVKEIGGSNYVIPKVKTVLEEYESTMHE